MKLRIAAVAALIVCSLCGCGSNRDKTSSIYTPAPITPRPTFDTTRYRTKEEIADKQDKEFVIVDSQVNATYPSVASEYERKILVDNEAAALEQDAEQERQLEEKKRQEEQRALEQQLRDEASRKQAEYLQQIIDSRTSAKTETNTSQASVLRTKDSIPKGFVSKNYPYSLYSSDGRTFIGTITLKSESAEMEQSIYNTSGTFGSTDSSSSIYNPNSIFGSSESMFSAFNENASAPPKIMDSQGNYIGQLTTNLRLLDGINPSTLKSYASDNNL